MKFTQFTPETRAQITFAGEYRELDLSESNLLRLVPYGVQVSTDGSQPMLLLKVENGEQSMPVVLNSLEAGVILAQFNRSMAPVTPHRAFGALLEGLKLKPGACVFVEIKGAAQWVKLTFVGARAPELKLKAEDALSFCLYYEVPVYATATFMAKSRLLNAQVEGNSRGIQFNALSMNSKRHPFIM